MSDKPLTARELRDQLDALIMENPRVEHLPVVFAGEGDDAAVQLVCGGIARVGHLVLAPLKLGDVGGF